MISKQDALNRIKHSLQLKEEMKRAADERLNRWQDELLSRGTVTFS